MEIALPQCAFGVVSDQPSAPSSPTQCLSVAKCTSPRSCCTRSLDDSQHHTAQHSHQQQYDEQEKDQQTQLQQLDASSIHSDAPAVAMSYPLPSVDSAVSSASSLPAVSIPSDVIQRLMSLNSHYTTLEKAAYKESNRPLLGAQ